MKDIIIKGHDLKRELWILLGCLLVSYGFNIYAIIHYDRPLIELVSTIGFVVIFGLIIYLVLLIVRIIVLILKKLIKR